MVQNPYTMGYLGMAQALAALKGNSTDSRIYRYRRVRCQGFKIKQ